MSTLCAPTAKSDLPPVWPNAARSVPRPSSIDPAAQIATTVQAYLGSEGFAAWSADLTQRLGHVGERVGYGLGHIEETIRQSAFEIQCRLVEKAMQAKADATPTLCTECLAPLSEVTRAVPKTIHVYCGHVELKRAYGFCAPCKKWCFPADFALGLLENSTASPLVQEISALLVSKMPAAQAEEIVQRVAGISLSRSTMAREAQRQGERGMKEYSKLVDAAGRGILPQQGVALPKGGTVVIQIDALNIRERDDWGKTEELKKAGQTPERWHWVYTATCFRLEQRCTTGGKQRAVIVAKSVIATRLGIEELMKQLHFEAQLRGLASAERVLVIADGAVWIWNAAKDRFPDAIQRLDLYHGNAYLWAVANEIHGSATAQARQWVKPLLKQIRQDQTVKVIAQLEELKPTLTAAKTTAVVDKTIAYYRNNQTRMQYVEAEKRNEPKGSGAIESVCRQIQCRVKRCGQFWTLKGDEAILRLETLWRNGHWGKLFPHTELNQLKKN